MPNCSLYHLMFLYTKNNSLFIMTGLQCSPWTHPAATGGCRDQSTVQRRLRRRWWWWRRRRWWKWRQWYRARAEWTASYRSSSTCGGDWGGRGWGDDLEIRGQACHHAVCSRDPLHGGCSGNHKVGQLLHPEWRTETVSFIILIRQMMIDWELEWDWRHSHSSLVGVWMKCNLAGAPLGGVGAM